MAGPNRYARLSQFWLPSLLFFLSLVSILFTLRNDEIPVIGPSERAVLDNSDLDSYRKMINQALQGSGSWQRWCENTAEAVNAVTFANFQSFRDDARWSEYRKYLPQAEQDALLRCRNASSRDETQLAACLFLVPKVLGKAKPVENQGLFLVELTVELRSPGKKKIMTCREALVESAQPIEMDAFYSYYWTLHTQKRLLRFERLTGGTRIFPPLAQNKESTAIIDRPLAD